MFWEWSVVPQILTPDGGGISAGVTYTADCIGVSTYSYSVSPSCLFYAGSVGLSVNADTVETLGYNVRDCIGVSSNTGLCDAGNGLTVLKGTSIYRDINVLEYQGNASFAGLSNRAILNILAGGDSVTYTTRVDFIGDTILYKGEAAVGSAESSAVWRIAKTTFAVDGDIVTTWALGTDTFTNAWADHLTVSYS
jgi:hypothetical protein